MNKMYLFLLNYTCVIVCEMHTTYQPPTVFHIKCYIIFYYYTLLPTTVEHSGFFLVEGPNKLNCLIFISR